MTNNIENEQNYIQTVVERNTKAYFELSRIFWNFQSSQVERVFRCENPWTIASKYDLDEKESLINDLEEQLKTSNDQQDTLRNLLSLKEQELTNLKRQIGQLEQDQLRSAGKNVEMESVLQKKNSELELKEKEIASLRSVENQLQTLKNQHQKQLESSSLQFTNETKALQKSHQEYIKKLQDTHKSLLEKIQKSHQEEIAKQKDELEKAKSEIASLKKAKDEAKTSSSNKKNSPEQSKESIKAIKD